MAQQTTLKMLDELLLIHKRLLDDMQKVEIVEEPFTKDTYETFTSAIESDISATSDTTEDAEIIILEPAKKENKTLEFDEAITSFFKDDFGNDDFNRLTTPNISRVREEPIKRKSLMKRLWQSPITGVMFYIVLALVIILTLVFTGLNSNGLPRDFAGYSAMLVLTRSMQSEIPQGSIVITQHVDPNTLEIGDDITFLRSEYTTFTHRIIDIIENFDEETGERGFQTKGIENLEPDVEIVIARNIVGKVIYHNLTIGRFFGFIRGNSLLSIALTIMLFGLVFALRMIFSPKREEEKELIFEKTYGNSLQ